MGMSCLSIPMACFCKGSTVDVNGIVGTTSDVSNANVMQGGKLSSRPAAIPMRR